MLHTTLTSTSQISQRLVFFKEDNIKYCIPVFQCLSIELTEALFIHSPPHPQISSQPDEASTCICREHYAITS